MSFLRLSRADAVAAVAALLLLLVMAMDWYSTEKGEELRRDQELVEPGVSRELQPSAEERLEEAAEDEEKNAWQAGALIDRLALIALLVAAATALAAAALRAADRRYKPPWTPSAITAWAGLAAALLVTYRIIQKPGLNEAAVIKLGAPLGLLCVGVLAVAARSAALAERERAELPPPSGEPVGEGDDLSPPAAEPDPGAARGSRPSPTG